MKKTIFYTMIKATHNSDAQAIPKTGYTDDHANYYTAGGMWFAIEKTTGHSFASDTTLKATREKAAQMYQKAKNFVEARPLLANRYKQAIKQAQQAAAICL